MTAVITLKGPLMVMEEDESYLLLQGSGNFNDVEGVAARAARWDVVCLCSQIVVVAPKVHFFVLRCMNCKERAN